MGQVRVTTLNIRNQFDRWDERLPLLLADMRVEQPDIMGLQEVSFPLQQDRVLAAAGEQTYRGFRGWVGNPAFGNTLLVRDSWGASDSRRADLEYLDRSAVGSTIHLPSGKDLLAVTTHILGDHYESVVRDRQVALLLEWLATWPPSDAILVMGDYNVLPTQAPYARMIDAGFRSAFVEAHGSEPRYTWPSGIEAQGRDEGDPIAIDFIFVRGEVGVKQCRLSFDKPSLADPTLFPSDHLGISAILEVG